MPRRRPTEADVGSLAMPTALGGIEMPLEIMGIAEPGIDCRRMKNFTQVWARNVHHATGGRLYVSVVSLPLPTPAPANLYVEARIIGMNAQIRDILQTAAVNSFTGPMVFDLAGYKECYTELGVEARQVIAGAPSDVAVPVLAMTIVGRLFR
jgi:hypothetical protein